MLVSCAALALHWLSLLVPEAGERERWRARWPQSLRSYARWVESRGLPRHDVRRLLIRFLRDGATEAINSRWQAPVVREEFLRVLRRPWVTLIIPCLVLAFGLWWSQGAALLRAAFTPISPAAKLVTAIPERSFFGKALGFTPQQFELVRTRARSYRAISGYAIRMRPVDGRVRRVALVTPGLFRMLGMKEGETYVAEQLGEAFRNRTILTDGRTYKVTGVWPRYFRPTLARPDYWIPVDSLEKLDATMIASLAPGVSSEAATRELREILLSAPARKGSGTPNAVIALNHSQAGMLGSLQAGFLITLGGLVAFALWHAVRRKTWRLELYFLAKSVPLVTGIFCCSVAGFGIPASGSSAGPFSVFWLTGIAAALGIWWARRDQKLRCPECLSRMTLSVQIGTHGASLLEGVGDEVLCEYGHGSLWLPGAASQAFGPEVWRGQ